MGWLARQSHGRNTLLYFAGSHDAISSKDSGASDTVDECPAVTSEQLKAVHSEEIAALG